MFYEPLDVVVDGWVLFYFFGKSVRVSQDNWSYLTRREKIGSSKLFNEDMSCRLLRYNLTRSEPFWKLMWKSDSTTLDTLSEFRIHENFCSVSCAHNFFMSYLSFRPFVSAIMILARRHSFNLILEREKTLFLIIICSGSMYERVSAPLVSVYEATQILHFAHTSTATWKEREKWKVKGAGYAHTLPHPLHDSSYCLFVFFIYASTSDAGRGTKWSGMHENVKCVDKIMR